jgi:hypothetical protein
MAAVTAAAPVRIPAIWIAARTGREEQVLQLLNEGADINAQGHLESSPLHAAGKNNHLNVVRLLLRHGADVSSQTIKGDTPLHWAAGQGHEAAATMLLQHGADLSAENVAGFTPEQFAIHTGAIQLAKMLKLWLEAEAVRRAQCVAFAMGQHDRLGAGSWVQQLDPGLVRLILDGVVVEPKVPGQLEYMQEVFQQEVQVLKERWRMHLIVCSFSSFLFIIAANWTMVRPSPS